MLKDFNERFAYIINKKRDTVLGIVGIALALCSGLPKPLMLFLIMILPILVWGLYKESMFIHKTFREKHIPFIIVAGRNDNEYEAMVSDVMLAMKEYKFEKHSFEDDFNVDQDNYIVRREKNLSVKPEEWEKQVHTFENKLTKLSAKLKGRKVFHLFLNCPAALAIGMGAVLGTKYEVVMHHYQLGIGQNPYHPVIDFYSMDDNKDGIHILKSRVNTPNQFIKIEEFEKTSSVVMVSLFLAGHDPKGDVEKKANNRSISTIHIRSLKSGTLPIDADWLGIVREVATYLLNLSGRSDINSIELYMSTPIVIAFALGMAVGTQTPILIYNWFSDLKEYYKVLELNKLRQPR